MTTADFDPQYQTLLPDLVNRARDGAHRIGVHVMDDGRPANDKERTGSSPSCSIPEMGALLATIVAAKPRGRFLETGAGAGVGAAWMAGALTTGATLTACEINAERAAYVAEIFAGRDDVSVIAGDWTVALAAADPFDVVFLDGAPSHWLDRDNWDAALGFVAPGGVILMDDVTPEELWPESWRGKPDPKREFMLRNPALLGAEVRLTGRAGALIATRRP